MFIVLCYYFFFFESRYYPKIPYNDNDAPLLKLIKYYLQHKIYVCNLIASANFSPIIKTGAFKFAVTLLGIIDASTTRNPSVS